jgi:hypothetical protein
MPEQHDATEHRIGVVLCFGGACLGSACPRRCPAESNGSVFAADTIDAFTGAAVCGVYVTLRNTTQVWRLGHTAALFRAPRTVHARLFRVAA